MKVKNIRKYLTEEQITERVKAMGEQISKDYGGETVYLICILKGSIFFTCELAKRITSPVEIDFMSVSSYGAGTSSSGVVKIGKDLDTTIEGKNVLVVEDIIDSGRTLSYLLQNLALLIFGSNTKSFPEVIKLPNLKLAGGKLTITGTTILTIVLCIVIMAGLMLFINKTKAGQAMLAVSEDKGAAQLMGINVNKTISMTFAIGSALAAIAGVLLCSAYPSLTPYTGSMPGIKAFVAAVFGGIGSIPGAMVGGILLGVIEIFGKAYISSQVADAICFAVLIVVLLVKPTGLFGKNIQEKV